MTVHIIRRKKTISKGNQIKKAFNNAKDEFKKEVAEGKVTKTPCQNCQGGQRPGLRKVRIRRI